MLIISPQFIAIHAIVDENHNHHSTLPWTYHLDGYSMPYQKSQSSKNTFQLKLLGDKTKLLFMSAMSTIIVQRQDIAKISEVMTTIFVRSPEGKFI